MAKTYTAAYRQGITVAQAGQVCINRWVYDSAVQSAADVIAVGVLPAGHRLVPELCRLEGNASIPAMNMDVYINAAANADAPTNLLWDDLAMAASTAESNAVDSGAYLMAHTIGVDHDYDREVCILVNSGFATAPAGGKVAISIASVPVSKPNYP
jgi:hypothetical protein